MNVKIVKLVTGEEFIADVTEGSSLTVRHARRFMITQQGVSLMPLSLFIGEKEELDIAMVHVVFIAKPSDEVENGYRQEVGGVVVPSKKIIL